MIVEKEPTTLRFRRRRADGKPGEIELLADGQQLIPERGDVLLAPFWPAGWAVRVKVVDVAGVPGSERGNHCAAYDVFLEDL